jgi:hypothetical protein
MTCKRILIDSTKLIRSVQPEMYELILNNFVVQKNYSYMKKIYQ